MILFLLSVGVAVALAYGGLLVVYRKVCGQWPRLRSLHWNIGRWEHRAPADLPPVDLAEFDTLEQEFRALENAVAKREHHRRLREDPNYRKLERWKMMHAA